MVRDLYWGHPIKGREHCDREQGSAREADSCHEVKMPSRGEVGVRPRPLSSENSGLPARPGDGGAGILANYEKWRTFACVTVS